MSLVDGAVVVEATLCLAAFALGAGPRFHAHPPETFRGRQRRPVISGPRLGHARFDAGYCLSAHTPGFEALLDERTLGAYVEHFPEGQLFSDGELVVLQWERIDHLDGHETDPRRIERAVETVCRMARHGMDRFEAIASIEGVRQEPAAGLWSHRTPPAVVLEHAGVEVRLTPHPQDARVGLRARAPLRGPLDPIDGPDDLEPPERELFTRSGADRVGTGEVDGQPAVGVLWDDLPDPERARAGARLAAAVAARTARTGAFR